MRLDTATSSLAAGMCCGKSQWRLPLAREGQGIKILLAQRITGVQETLTKKRKGITMSAYMVDREHIAYLLDAAVDTRITDGHFYWYHNGESHHLRCGDFERAAAVGQMLWNANADSIFARYPDTHGDLSNAPGPIGEFYVYDEHRPQYGLVVEPVQVLKSCNCFAYQSCEHEGWKDSEAKAFIDALIHHAIGRLPGYDKATWGAPERKGRHANHR